MKDAAITVLVADDHTLLRRGLVKLLELSDEVAVVGQATNGVEVLQCLEASQPDIVLMDINMPELNGIEATKQITAQYPAVKVLALTIHDDEQYVSEMIRAGAKGYLLKDVEPGSVVQAIQRVVGGETYFPAHLMERVMNRYHSMVMQNGGSRDEDKGSELTKRELEVLSCIVDGMSNKEIASYLCISEKTVKNHITNILRKLDLMDRTQAAVYAVQHGLRKAGA